MLRGQYSLRVGIGFPELQGPLVLGLLAEDQTEEHVQAPNGEKEECRNEREVIDVVGEDGSSNETLENSERTKTESPPLIRSLCLKNSVSDSWGVGLPPSEPPPNLELRNNT